MKIAESSVVLSASSTYSSQREVSESLRIGISSAQTPQGTSNSPASLGQEIREIVSLSEMGKAAQAHEASNAQAIEEAMDSAEHDPRTLLIKQLIEAMAGRKIRLLSATDIHPGNARRHRYDIPAVERQSEGAGFSLVYDYRETYEETEALSFKASGIIHTADGEAIQFDLSLQMQRSYTEESSASIRAGDAALVDPLVIKFSGSSTELTNQRFSFDLNTDGEQEEIAFIKGGGFLALDRNQDGQINNGSELFGPGTGNGFTELKTLDGDDNGWIDENDAIYEQLRIWTKDNEGSDRLSSLKESNVGALFLGSVNAPYSIKDVENQLQAQIRASGVWLSEDGQAGVMQQIDLVV